MSGTGFFLFFLMMLGCSCARTLGPAQTSAPAETGVLFLAYELKKDTATSTVETRMLHQVLRRDASFVDDVEERGTGLEIRFLDDKGELIKVNRLEDPFAKQVEAVDDNQRLIKKEVFVTRAEVITRVKYDPKMKTILLVLMEGQKARTLFKHDIKL